MIKVANHVLHPGWSNVSTFGLTKEYLHYMCVCGNVHAYMNKEHTPKAFHLSPPGNDCDLAADDDDWNILGRSLRSIPL